MDVYSLQDPTICNTAKDMQPKQFCQQCKWSDDPDFQKVRKEIPPGYVSCPNSTTVATEMEWNINETKMKNV